MKYSELFNIPAQDGPYLRELVSKAADRLNAPPAISDADFKQALADYTSLDKATGTLTIDLDKMSATPATGAQFQERLGVLFDGLAERGGMVEGRKVTVKAVPAPPAPAAKAPESKV